MIAEDSSITNLGPSSCMLTKEKSVKNVYLDLYTDKYIVIKMEGCNGLAELFS